MRNGCRVRTIALAAAVIAASAAKSGAGALLGVSLRFEPNHGQAGADADFVARTRAYSARFTAASIELRHPRLPQPMRIDLVGADRRAAGWPEVELCGRSHYLFGDQRDWLTDVGHFARIRYAAIYSGIDIVHYGNGRDLEHDFIVAPGADPSAIRLAFDGVESVRLGSDGALVLEAGVGAVRFARPVATQLGADGARPVDAHYAIASPGVVGFEIGDYDPGLPLRIDPVLSYSTYLGGADLDQVFSVAVDAAGSAYVTGMTRSIDFPTASPMQSASGGAADVFVSKLTPAGDDLIYSTYLGGSSSDGTYGTSIAIDAAGNAYVVGDTTSADFPTVSPIYPLRGFRNAFVSKLDPSGANLVYSTFIGGSFEDSASAVAVDAAGNAYVTGGASSADFPTVGPVQSNLAGAGNAFVTKIDPAGASLVYSTYLGGTTQDGAFDIAIDGAGSAIIVGLTVSSNYPTRNSIDSTYGGGQDGFASKLDPSGGALVYSTYLGGDGSDGAHAVALDAAGNAWIVGATSSTDILTMMPLQPAKAGSTDVFVIGLNPAGGQIYGTYFGGSDNDNATGVAIDPAGNIVFGGGSFSTDYPLADPYQSTGGGASFDVTVSALAPDGQSLVYSTYIGGTEYDSSSDLAVDDAGDVYVVGQTDSTDYPTRLAYQPAYGGAGDGFVTKLSPSGCAAPGAVADLTIVRESADLRIGWLNRTDATSYDVFEDTDPNSSFPTRTGSETTGAPGLLVAIPAGDLIFYRVAGVNSCGPGPK